MKLVKLEKKSSDYAANSNFFHFAESSTNIDERNTNNSGTYTPIMKVLLDSYRRGEGNIVERTSEKIAKVMSCGNSGAYSIFEHIVSELFRNIPEHSHSFEGWYCAQSWEHGDYIEAEFALIDYGIGYRGSLNFRGDRKISDDIEALKLAMQPGITAGIIDKSHLREGEESDYLNSGYGLYIVTELCKKFKGQFVIVSKGAFGTNKKINLLADGLIFPGTAIKIRLKIPKEMNENNFNKLLKEIVSNGEIVSKSVKGAINTASVRSKRLSS